MKNKLIKDGRYLDHAYVPDELPGRASQISRLMEHLSDCNVKSRNAIIMGDRGTGKTAVSKKVCAKDLPHIMDEKDIKCKGIIVNCKQSNTTFRVYQQMIFQITGNYPYIKNSEQDARMMFLSIIKDLDCLVVVLDEADMLGKNHLSILYDLSRFQEQGMTDCKISVVAVSNNVMFPSMLDSKTRSSLCQVEFIFEPYNTPELERILMQRAELALIKGSYSKPIINRIASIAAQEEGDARYAIWLLSQSAEIAGRLDYDEIKLDCIRLARRSVEEERVKSLVKSLVVQKKLVLMGVLSATNGKNGGELPTTGEVYDRYCNYCDNLGIQPVTDRRAIDFLSDLDNMGLIKKKLVSRGRYGRTHEIFLQVPYSILKDTLEEDLGMSEKDNNNNGGLLRWIRK